MHVLAADGHRALSALTCQRENEHILSDDRLRSPLRRLLPARRARTASRACAARLRTVRILGRHSLARRVLDGGRAVPYGRNGYVCVSCPRRRYRKLGRSHTYRTYRRQPRRRSVARNAVLGSFSDNSDHRRSADGKALTRRTKNISAQKSAKQS